MKPESVSPISEILGNGWVDPVPLAVAELPLATAAVVAAAAVVAQPLPKISDIGLTLSGFTAPGDAILVAGSYSGTIVVTLGPAATAQ